MEYGSFDDVKKLYREHEMAGELGGKNVAERHFVKITFEELRTSYQYEEGNEFVDLFVSINDKLQ